MLTQDLPDRSPKAGSGYQKKTGTIFGHRLNAAWTRKRRAANENDARGPLGLRLLHAAPQPLIDIIFVHGLRGGSNKTWRKGDEPRLFWPQQWLPMEPGLNNANIRSFGYDSDWASSNPNILNVHEFGRELFEEMQSSPFL
ncbi:putative GPI inositol-deacylase [Seiridium cardinale]|uniref:GPI inositol-deacylase n=1 Tax=Seiridium cardinale TaxID=138064 RepID=A0ABR2Y5Y9_9PEZI